MPLKDDYGRTIFRELKEHAVWDPGDDIRLGDFGIVEDYCFKRLGHVTDCLRGIKLRSSESKASNFEFVTRGVSVQRAEASIPLDTASIRIRGKNHHSFFLKAKDSITETISNLSQLRAAMEESKRWDRSWKIVTKARRAERFVLLVASGDQSEIRVSATPHVLDDLVLGKVSAEAEITIEGDCAYRLLGKSGAVLVELRKLRVFPWDPLFSDESGVPGIRSDLETVDLIGRLRGRPATSDRTAPR